jgi:hypothetical protein
VSQPTGLQQLAPPDRISVRRIGEEICRERCVPLGRDVFAEALNLWFQGYRPRPAAPRAVAPRLPARTSAG